MFAAVGMMDAEKFEIFQIMLKFVKADLKKL